MSNGVCSQLRRVGAISFLIFLEAFVVSSTRATCYSTPRAAVDAIATSSLFPQALNSDGYKVTGVQLDQVMGRRWAMISNCAHPEWPAFALPTNRGVSFIALQEVGNSLTEGAKASPVVRAGDIVRLWRQESLVRIEVTGVSEESGGLDKTIRVRVVRRNADDQTTPQQLSGVVRGPSNVEIQP